MPDIDTDSLVIVIDPGHGGDEEGGLCENLIEKDMNLVVANAMKEELEKYEDVTVYLTRTGDQKLSLEQRSAYAKSVNADIMFCLHFNISEKHTLFGTECWVSAFGEEYSIGQSFADVFMNTMEELGLHTKGAKTRLDENGADYYGIIRTASELDIPCVLIEHCYMDHENDRPFCEGPQQWETFGQLDATAAAKFFNLRSVILDVDYSDYATLTVPVPDYVMRPDYTPPDVCMIDLVSQDMATGEVTIELSGADYDSGMLYYAYSYDGGETFSALQPWTDKSQDTIHFTMQVPPHILPKIVVNGYNGYDLHTMSNLLSLPSMDYKTQEEAALELERKDSPETDLDIPADILTDQDVGKNKETSKEFIEVRRPAATQEQPVSLGYFLNVCLVCALLVFAMVLSISLPLRYAKRRRRRRKIK